MDALLLAVLNALWQGAALIGLAALSLRAGLRRNATTACIVWSAAFGVVALLPVIDLALARPGVSAGSSPGVYYRQPVTTRVPAEATAAFVVVDGPAAAPRVPEPLLADLPGPSLSDRWHDTALAIGAAATAFARSWGIFVLGAWAVVAGALVLRLARGYAAIARMKRGATPLADPAVLARLRAAGHRRHADVACSTNVEIPCAVGFRRPMILLPAGLAASLDADDLARVILHESAHLQRYDDWTNALEQVVCALQFFQPALYVARRGIDFEREVACDDRVVEDAGEPLRYAECLARIVQRHLRGRQAAVVPGFVLRRAQVVARVRRIVDRSRDASPQLRVATFALGATLLAATLGMARLQVPVVAPAVAAPIVADCSCPPVAHRTAPRALVMALVPAPHPPAHAVAQAAAIASPSPSPTPAVGRRTAAHPSTHSRTHSHSHAHAKLHAHSDLVHSQADVATDAAPAAEELARTAAALADVAAQDSAMAPAMAPVMAPPTSTLTVTARRISFAPLVAARVALENASATSFTAPRRFVILASSGDGGDLLDAIDGAKYPHPSVDDLVALRNAGISADYIRRMGALGPNRPSLHQLLALALQNVSPAYLATLDRRLISPSLDDAISLRVQGVSAVWLDGLAAAGYQRLTPAEAASLTVQGVSVVYVRGLLEAGLRNVTPQQLAALHVQGIDGPFVRRLAQHGYRNLNLEELVRLKVSGFEP